MENFEKLTIYSDGGARGNPGPAAAAFVIKDEDDNTIANGGEYLGETTNNVAEYNGVVLALSELKKNFSHLDNPKVIYYLDSKLVVNQLNGVYKIKNQRLREIVHSIKSLEKQLPFHVMYQHVPRVKNSEADALVNKTIDNAIHHVK